MSKAEILASDKAKWMKVKQQLDLEKETYDNPF